LTRFYFSLGFIYQQELTYKMKLIQVDQETHQALKVLAVTKGVSLKDLVQNLLAKALKGDSK